MKTYIIDTNYILRLLLKDIKSQASTAHKLFKEIEDKKARGLISILVVNEIIWIFESYYKKSRKEFIPQIEQLFSLKNIKILEIKKKDLMRILDTMITTSLDFTDFILSYYKYSNKTSFASFDKKLQKLKKL